MRRNTGECDDVAAIAAFEDIVENTDLSFSGATELPQGRFGVFADVIRSVDYQNSSGFIWDVECKGLLLGMAITFQEESHSIQNL